MISLEPKQEDYEVKVKQKGKKVILTFDTVPVARAFIRQIANHLTADTDSMTRIGFTSDAEE